MIGLWTISEGNTKTGPIPTQYIGESREETHASCKGCNLHPEAGGGCYAWSGNSQRALNSVQTSGRDKTLPAVLSRAPRGARFARFGAIGDPARVERTSLLRDLASLNEAGIKPIGYTHHHRSEPRTGSLKGVFLASCDTMEQADSAIKAGWLVALAGPESAPGMVRCRNYDRPEITCNTCGLCNVDTLRKTGFRGVVFPAHGQAAKRLPLAGVNA